LNPCSDNAEWMLLLQMQISIDFGFNLWGNVVECFSCVGRIVTTIVNMGGTKIPLVSR
jgi:hypothetical protein